MFQTEIHRWLQSSGTPLIEYFMRGISMFGEEEFLALLMLIVIFGVERSRGFFLTQVLLWTAIVTALLKDAFALPRPIDVDAMVRDIPGERNVPTPFTGRGATGFLDLLPPDVVAYFRSLPHISFGFPSGHCSTTVAVSGSAAILWRSPWTLRATMALVILMPLSRMYLGRHFLADVLAGAALGFLAVFVVVLIRRDSPADRPSTFIWVFNVLALFALPAACIPLFPGDTANEAAMLLGVNLGQAWTERVHPEPEPVSSRWRRVLHAAIAVVMFVGVTAAFRAVSHSLAGADALLPKTANRLLVPCISIFVASWIIHRISTRKQST